MKTPNRLAAGLFSAALMALAAAAPAHGHQVKLKDLVLVHPHTVEPASPAEKDMIVTMTIHNHGKTADHLIAAASGLAAAVEIVGGGDATNSIALPAGGTVLFSKPGPHIILHGIKEEMAGYATFPLQLTFEKAGRIEAEVLVEESEAAPTPNPKSESNGEKRR